MQRTAKSRLRLRWARQTQPVDNRDAGSSMAFFFGGSHWAFFAHKECFKIVNSDDQLVEKCVTVTLSYDATVGTVVNTQQGSQCRGVFIDKSWFLTSAHCSVDEDSRVASFGIQPSERGTQVVKVYNHPGYPDDCPQTTDDLSSDCIKHDIKLVKVNQPTASWRPLGSTTTQSAVRTRCDWILRSECVVSSGSGYPFYHLGERVPPLTGIVSGRGREMYTWGSEIVVAPITAETKSWIEAYIERFS